MSAGTLPELAELERILDEHAGRLRARTLCEVSDGERRFPLLATATRC